MVRLLVRALVLAAVLVLLPTKRQKRRRRLPARLRAAFDRWLKIERRLDKLRDARRYRASRVVYWRREHRRRVKRYGQDDLRSRKALHKLHSAQALLEEIKESQRVLIRRADRKLDRIEKWEKRHPQKLTDSDRDGLMIVDGKPVAWDVGKELLRIRAAGRWKGYVVSGYRTPEYSEHLCYGICGRSSCPGLCAGRSTNHARKGRRQGAVDLTDYLTFAAECRRLGSWLENHLPRDLVHFSDSGV